MKIDLVLKEGDYLTLDGSKVSMKTIKLGKLLKQRKKAGQIIFSYEFPDDIKFSKPKKAKIAKLKKKKPEKEVSIDDILRGVEDPEEISEDEEVEDIEEIQPIQPKRQAQSSKIKLRRNTNFISDPDIAPKESKIALARVKPKPNAPTQHKYVKKHCHCCGEYEIVPESETLLYKGMRYRCNKCYGG